MSLSAKEEAFCRAYVNKLDKAKAALAAGYSKKTARQIGYENFTKPYIQNRIKEIQQEIKEQLGIDEYSVLKELAALGYWNIKDFVDSNNKIKDISKLTREKLKPVTGIKVTTSTTTFDGGEREESTVDLKFADKKGSLIDLGRHLGIFEKDNLQQNIKIIVTRK